MNQQPPVNVNLALQPEFNCPKCKCHHFHQVSRMRILAGLLVGQKNNTLFPTPVISCVNCGYEPTQDDVDLQLKEKGVGSPALNLLTRPGEG